MNYKTIRCDNCKNEFIFSLEEQDLYKKRGLPDPRVCPICRGMMGAKSRDKARLEDESKKKIRIA